MEISAIPADWLVRVTGLALMVLGLLTWNGSNAVAGWQLLVMGGPRQVAKVPAVESKKRPQSL